MLKKVVVENYKIFKDRVEFDLEATKYQILNDRNVKEGVLKGALVVGANASGKSTLISAIELLLNLLFRDNDFISVLDGCLYSNKKNIHFEFEFLINKKNISYIFDADRDGNIVSEHLSVAGDTILKRNGMDGKIYVDKNEILIDKNKFSQNILLLKRCYFASMFEDNKDVVNFIEFLRHSVSIDALHQTSRCFANESLLVERIDQNKLDSLNRMLNQLNIGFNVERHNVRVDQATNLMRPMVFFTRKGLNVPIPSAIESSGNQNLANIMPAVDYCCNNNGMLLIDEFSSGFHNKLEECLIKYFFEHAESSQIIFVSHSTNLLTSRLLRPDQIYVVDYDNEKKTSYVKRVSDENPREAQNLEKMYLSGKFGGVPKYDYDN